jgi:hypothetical protein
MATQYLIESSKAIPLHLTIQFMPLMTSFGAWHRLEMRVGGTSSNGAIAERARCMKWWCVSAVTGFKAKWPVGNPTYEGLVKHCEILMGDPLATAGAPLS